MFAHTAVHVPPRLTPFRGPNRTPNPYRSIRARAWRNAMVAALNVGLERDLFGRGPGQNLWPGADEERSKQRIGAEGFIYRFEFAEDVPGIAWVGDAGFGELALHVALWPTLDAPRWVVCANGGRLAGAVWAAGWFERRSGPYLQSSPCHFAGARDCTPLVAATDIVPRASAYADRGHVRF